MVIGLLRVLTGRDFCGRCTVGWLVCGWVGKGWAYLLAFMDLLSIELVWCRPLVLVRGLRRLLLPEREPV